MTYTVTIHFSSADKTYTILRSGWTLPQTVGAKGKHATQSLNLSILSSEAFALFLTETKQNVKAEVKQDGVVIFQGVVRPYLSTSATGIKEGAVNLQILDYTELLHYYIPEAETIEGKNLDETIDTLFQKAGVDISRTYPTEFSSDSVGYLAMDEGEYIDEVLSTLLYERGYDYRFTATGCEFFATTTETEPAQTISDIRGTLSVQRDDDWNEGLSVTYPRAKEDDVVIYTHKREETDPASIGGGRPVHYPWGTKYEGATGVYYDGKPVSGRTTPPEGTAKVSWSPLYNEKTTSNIKLIGVKNARASAWLDDEEGVTLTPHVENVKASGGRVWLSYSGTFDEHNVPIVSWFGACIWTWTWNIEVKARVQYLIDDSVEVASADGQRPDTKKQTLSYIYTEELAQKYVQTEIKRQKTSTYTYSFSSLTAYSAGNFYKLQDSVTGVNQTVRILSCSQGADGIYSIKAESASTMSISDIGIKKLYYSDMQNAGSSAFRIHTTKDTLQDDADTATLTLSGVITGSSEISYKWTLGETELSTASSLVITTSQLTAGANTIKCAALYQNEEMATATCTLTRVNAQGVDGKDGASITVQYTYSTSETEPPEEAIMQWAGANIYWSDGQAYWSEWYDKAPVPKEGYYIWMRSKVGDGEWSYTRLTGSTGVQGVGISEIVEKYARNNDSTTAPDESAFSTDIPKLASNIRFLWNYEIVKLTDGTEKTTAKRIIGVYGDTGATGYSQALITLYQRSATVPSKPIVDTVYYFATGVLEGDIGLWSRAVTTGDDPLYAISASALGQGESYTIESTAWTTPAIMSESGTAGENGYTVMSITIYQRADSAPSVPTNATYNIESKTLSEIGSWSKTYPENSDKPLWATLATISTRESSVSIPSSSWSTPQVLTQNGATGNGIASITNYYLASASDSGITRDTSGWNTDPTTQTTSPVVKYLWNYEDILYTNGSHDYSEARIIGTYGDSGTPAKLCTLTCDHTTVARNERRSDYQTVAFIVDVQGYKNAPSLFVNDAEVTLSQSTTVSTQYSASMNVYYNSAESLVAIVYIDSVQLDKVSISVVDETENGIYLGIQSAFPTTYEGLALLAGDSCVYNNRVYIYNPAVQEGQEPWQIASESTLTNVQKSHALSSAMNDILSSITADTITSSDYAYFKTLITDTISADYISSQEITVTKSIQSAEITKDKGFKLSSDGTITANKATLNNVQISDGEFSADSLKTQNADENGSFYAITGTPSESGSASTEVKSVADDGTITTVGTLTKTQDNYYKTKDFAQWCLDNIPVNNAGFTQLEGTIDGYNAYAMRFSSTPSASYTTLLKGEVQPSSSTTKEATVDCGLYQREVKLKIYKDGVFLGSSCTITVYADNTQFAKFYSYNGGNSGNTSTLNGKNISWSTSDDSSYDGMYSFSTLLPSGVHTLKVVIAYTTSWVSKMFKLNISTTDVVTPYWSRLALQNSNSILLMLYQSDSSIVFNGGTASNPLKVISINSDITDNTTMTSLGSLTPNDTTYSTMAVNLLYNGVACVCGENQTSWTVTRYFKFLGLYNCGAGSWATPTIAGTISVKVKSAFIDGTQQNQELTLQYNGTNLTLTSDDKTIAYQLDTGDYYTSLPSICMTAIASSKGAYVSSLYPMQAGESDIGSASQPFDQVYANSYRNMFPVGAIYMSVNPTSPASLFGGRWEALGENHTLWTTAWTDSTTTDLTTASDISAGIPNITGGFSSDNVARDVNISSKGAFTWGNAWARFTSSTNYDSTIGWKFDASKGEVHNGKYSNLVYGKSDTVQPPAYKIYAWKRLPDSTT